jgi:hypothetical protein
LFGNVWKIPGDINAATRPELFVVQASHSLKEGTVLGPGGLLRDLNTEINQASELHVVQLDKPIFESDLARHASDAA